MYWIYSKKHTHKKSCSLPLLHYSPRGRWNHLHNKILHQITKCQVKPSKFAMEAGNDRGWEAGNVIIQSGTFTTSRTLAQHSHTATSTKSLPWFSKSLPVHLTDNTSNNMKIHVYVPGRHRDLWNKHSMNVANQTIWTWKYMYMYQKIKYTLHILITQVYFLLVMIVVLLPGGPESCTHTVCSLSEDGSSIVVSVNHIMGEKCSTMSCIYTL